MEVAVLIAAHARPAAALLAPKAAWACDARGPKSILRWQGPRDQFQG
jgi:hypothetical protein